MRCRQGSFVFVFLKVSCVYVYRYTWLILEEPSVSLDGRFVMVPPLAGVELLSESNVTSR